jgi:hypothetical protein
LAHPQSCRISASLALTLQETENDDHQQTGLRRWCIRSSSLHPPREPSPFTPMKRNDAATTRRTRIVAMHAAIPCLPCSFPLSVCVSMSVG